MVVWEKMPFSILKTRVKKMTQKHTYSKNINNFQNISSHSRMSPKWPNFFVIDLPNSHSLKSSTSQRSQRPKTQRPKERLSFGITLLLVVEVMRTSVATFVPICGELLWIDLFMLVNSVPRSRCCLEAQKRGEMLAKEFGWLDFWLLFFLSQEFWRSSSREIRQDVGPKLQDLKIS